MFRLVLRPGDWAVLAVSVIIVVVLAFLTVTNPGGTPMVRIEGADDSWLYPLDSNVVIAVPGPLGDTHVHVQDGNVWVSDSPCRQKICVATGEISDIGTFIACLPNRVLVRIEGKKEGEIDELAF